MTEIFLHIVNMSITASILVVVVLLLRLILKKAPKWISVLLWGLVAIRLICPFAVESPFSLMPKTDWIEEESVLTGDDFSYGVAVDSIPVDSIRDFSFLDKEIEITYYPTDPEIEIQKSVSIPFILSCIWIGGMGLLLLYTVISTVRLRRSVRVAIWVRYNIWESSAVDSPFVLGLFNPRIYVPRSLTEENLAYVIAHEEAHISRRDHWWKPLGFLLLTVHWFNPVMWAAYILLCRDIEMACDERVVKNMRMEERADYSEALLECSVKRLAISACPLAFGEVGVKQRIKSVLNYKKPAFWIVAAAVLASFAAAVCFLTNPGSLHFQNISGAGLRFPTTKPYAAQWCDIIIDGRIIRDEFKGTFSVDGRQVEASIDMTSDTPSVRYYEGSRLKSYGLLLVFNDQLDKFALRLEDSDEYVLFGMTFEEFEAEMRHRNYYVNYLHDVVLHDFAASDQEQILSDIYTEGRTVVIYGRNLDIGEINRIFYSGDNVLGGKTVPMSYPDVSVCYACVSTCLDGTVHVGYYRLTHEGDADEADIAELLDRYLAESSLRDVGVEFRNKMMKMYGSVIDSPRVRYEHETESKFGPFWISFSEDGTFSYMVSSVSSYLGLGTWKMEGDILTLTENMDSTNRINHFRYDGKDLLFVEDGSDNFPQEKLQDGDRFFRQTIHETTSSMFDFPFVGEIRNLTLDDVIILSKKGYDLTWDDFHGYNFIETGSGLYIRVYEIDETFQVWIGGGSVTEKPMYIYLTLADNRDTKIDIRDGGVEEFIRQYPSSGVNDTILLFDRPVSYYVDLAWEEAVRIAEAESITIDKNRFNIRHGYNGGKIWIQFLGLTEEGWDDRSVDVSLVRDENGEYSVSADGGTIISQKALQKNLSLSLIAQRIEYLETVIEANPRKYANDIPRQIKEYDQLFVYGSDLVLEYIFSEFLAGGQTDLHGFVLRKVMTDILNENEKIAYDAVNGQDYFDHWLKSARSVAKQHDAAWLEENVPAIALVLKMAGDDDGGSSPTITVTETKKEALNHTEHHEYIHDQSRYTRYLLIRASSTISNVRITSMTLGDAGMEVYEDLYTLPELNPQKPLLLGVVFYGDLTTYGLLFTDENGTEHQYMIYESGKDGSVILQPNG